MIGHDGVGRADAAIDTFVWVRSAASVDVLVLRFDELEAPVVGFFDFGRLVWQRDQHARRRPLCLASLADLSSALHVDVGHVLVLAQDW